MKTRKIKGGYIEKIKNKWTITGPKGNPTVNEYRQLELIELDKLASLSKSSNSNEALKEMIIEDAYKEMCDSNPKPTDDIEDTKKNMRSIINLRNQESIRMFKHNETLEEKRNREGHEFRLNLWRKKYKKIREIYFNHYGENTQDELTFLSSEKNTLLEKKEYLNEQLHTIDINISVMNQAFEELKTISKDLNNVRDNRNVKDRIVDILFQLGFVYPHHEMSEWIKPFIQQKEDEIKSKNVQLYERKIELEKIIEEVQFDLKEVADDIITTPLKTPQKPSREQEGNNLLDQLGAEELTPVKTKEVKKTKEEEEQIALEEGRLLAEKEQREQIVSDLFEWEIKRVIITSLNEEFKKTKNKEILEKLMPLKKEEKQNNIKMIKSDTETLQELKRRISLEIEILKKYNEAYGELEKEIELLKTVLTDNDIKIFKYLSENEPNKKLNQSDINEITKILKIPLNTFFLEKYEHREHVWERMILVRQTLYDSTGERYADYLDMTVEIERNLSKLSGGKRKTYKRKLKIKKY